MIKVIKNGIIYNPVLLGKKDILIANDKIAGIEDKIEVPEKWPVEVIDADGNFVVPGFIDGHVHICGGGLGAYSARVPEINLSDLTKAGITTIISFLGADPSTKTYNSLLGKAYGLIEEGISCRLLLGSYYLPTRTLTGNIVDDIVLIEKFIGVKAAISCPFLANGTKEELAKAVSDASLGGMISGKAGVTVLHVGDSALKLDVLEEVIKNYDLPKQLILPTHINRNMNLLESGIEYLRNGGFIDLTTIIHDIFPDQKELKCSNILRRLLDEGCSMNRVMFSTDGNGQISDKEDDSDKIEIASPSTLHREFRDSVLDEGIDITTALRVITENTAGFFKLKDKGRIKVGGDGDVNIIDKDSLEIIDTLAMGRSMVRNRKVVRLGEFEK